MSKKLEGNGFWESSRMMLPEHREALVQRRQAKAEDSPKRNVPTREEMALIRNYALLPMILSIAESNRRNMETSSYALKKLYITVTGQLMNCIHADLAKVKKALKERDIKVYEDERVDGAIRYRFICRGYEGSLAMTREVVRAEISVKIADYIRIRFCT